MACGKSARVGSASKTTPPHIPHVRVENEQHLEQFYEFGHKLGQGNFGIVLEALHKDTGTQWACKVINKEKVSSHKVLDLKELLVFGAQCLLMLQFLFVRKMSLFLRLAVPL